MSTSPNTRIFLTHRSRCSSAALTAAIALVIVVMTMLSSRASAQSDHKNAAMWYARAIANWNHFRLEHPDKVNLLFDFAHDPAARVTPEIRAVLSNLQGVISDYRRGSQQEYCDFALDHSQGFEMLLPHLNEMRGIVRAMRADAAIRIADGDTNGAAALLSSMYKSSGHFGDDRTLISSLVGQAVFSLADAGVQQALDNAQFNAGDAASLLTGALALDQNDPFQYAEGMAMEQEIVLATFEKYRGAEGIQLLHSLIGLDGDDDDFRALGSMDDDSFAQQMSLYDQMLSEAHAIFSSTDKDAALTAAAKMEESVTNGEYGVLAKVMAPAYAKLIERKFAGAEMLQARIETLKELAGGTKQPEDVANAAVWYLRAIELWESKPIEFRASVLQHAENDTAAAQQHAALIEMQSVLDIVRDASTKRRCDFSTLVRYDGLLPIAPHYAPGMSDLLTVLHRDASRLYEMRQLSEATERLAISLRMCGHMAGDTHLAVCRMAHVGFNTTLDAIESASQAGVIDVPSANAAVLAEAAGRISRTDPFGYAAALERTRENLARRIFPGRTAFTEDELAVMRQQLEIVRGYNADQAMFTLVMLDERERRIVANPQVFGSASGTGHPLTSHAMIERLHGVLDADAVESARMQFDEIGPRMEAGDFTYFVGREVMPIASLASGQLRARSDLRRATRLLMLQDAEREETEGAQP